MNKFISWVKNIRPVKILTAFLAVTILLFTQACGSQVDATAPAPTNKSYETPRNIKGPQSAEPNSEVYVPKGTDATSPYEGGINNFSDTDPRSKAAKADVKAKTEAFKENAEQHLDNRSGNVQENVRRVLDDREELGKNIQRGAANIKDKTQESAEDFAKGTKRGVENIQENTKDAAKGAADNVQGAVEDTKYNAKRTVDKAGEAVNRTANETSENVKSSARETSEDAAGKGKNIIEKAKEFVQGTAEDAAKSAQRNLDNANDAVKDTVD